MLYIGVLGAWAYAKPRAAEPGLVEPGAAKPGMRALRVEKLASPDIATPASLGSMLLASYFNSLNLGELTDLGNVDLGAE